MLELANKTVNINSNIYYEIMEDTSSYAKHIHCTTYVYTEKLNIYAKLL